MNRYGTRGVLGKARLVASVCSLIVMAPLFYIAALAVAQAAFDFTFGWIGETAWAIYIAILALPVTIPLYLFLSRQERRK